MVQFPGGKRDFYILQNYRTGEGPLSLLFSEYFNPFHLVPRLNNEWRYTSAPPTCFNGKGRENLIFCMPPTNTEPDVKYYYLYHYFYPFYYYYYYYY
jgi:hypothetical protein